MSTILKTDIKVKSTNVYRKLNNFTICIGSLLSENIKSPMYVESKMIIQIIKKNTIELQV